MLNISPNQELNQAKSAYREIKMSDQQIEKMKEKMEQAKKENRRQHSKIIVMKTASAIAAACALFVILPNTSAGVAHAMGQIPVLGNLVDAVTFRNYQFEDERNLADVEIPEIVIQAENSTMTDEIVQSSVQDTLQKTTEEINAEIQQITEKIITEFEESKMNEEGYQDITVKSEVISTTQQYFTLKLICFYSSGSGAEWDYFYTINLETGERMAIKDLFQEGADYVTPISESIKQQMRDQMAADEMIAYWLDSEVPEWDFQQISDETAFYVNADGKVVIAFDEGEVAPMYMGCVEFIIPDEVIGQIRK